MAKRVKCGNCGRTLYVTPTSDHIYYVGGKYYCWFCAAQLPKHIMKRCGQCAYFSTDKKGTHYCKCDVSKKVESLSDACNKYKSNSLCKILNANRF